MSKDLGFFNRRIAEKQNERDELIKGLPLSKDLDADVRRLAEMQTCLDKWREIYQWKSKEE